MGRPSVILWIVGGLGLVLVLSAYYNVTIGQVLRGQITANTTGATTTAKPITGVYKAPGAKLDAGAASAARLRAGKIWSANGVG